MQTAKETGEGVCPRVAGFGNAGLRLFCGIPPVATRMAGDRVVLKKEPRK